MLSKEIKRLWVEALRSDKYQQGKGYLRSNTDKFCCLGVLLDVIDSESWKCQDNCFSWENHTGNLPRSIALDIGPREQVDLMRQNDTLERSFKEIADWIKENIQCS